MGGGVLLVLPIAQASVLRWVLMGGISANQIFFGMAFVAGVLVLVRWLVPALVGMGCWERVRGVGGGVVFGALLGPEATGPFCSNARNGFGVSLFPATGCRRTGCLLFLGWVVWWGWLMGLLFENYIVDASIWTCTGCCWCVFEQFL
jgi:hypothetical protein